MRSTVARAWVLVVVSTLLLAACGQAPTGSVPTDASSSQPTAASDSAPTAASSTGAASGDAIPTRIAVAQTSNVALLGQDQIDGSKLADDYFKKKGGVNGRPIKLVYQDT